jgi:hypothetical protein
MMRVIVGRRSDSCRLRAAGRSQNKTLVWWVGVVLLLFVLLLLRAAQ